MLKKFKYFLCLIGAFGVFCQMNAQDVHFSQNYATPLYVNPGMAGLYNGDFRITADYRNQWAALTSTTDARTITLSADAKVLQGITKGGWLSAGLLLYNDKSGFLSYNTNSADISLAYSTPMDGDKHYVSFGAMFGVSTRAIDLSEAEYASQFDGNIYNPTLPTGESMINDRFTRLNLSGGAVYYYLESSRKFIFAGASAYNIIGTTFSFTDDNDTNLPIRLSFHAGGSWSLSRRLDIVPGAYFMQQLKSMKTDVGTLFRFIFFENIRSQKFRAFNIGPYVRINKHFDQAIGVDALILAVKLDYDDVALGLSYDFNISEFNNATKGKGGPEVSFVYSPTFRPNPRSNVNCPRF